MLADQEVRSLLDGALAFVLKELGVGIDLPRCMGCAYVNEVPETILVSRRVVRQSIGISTAMEVGIRVEMEAILSKSAVQEERKISVT